MLAIDLFCGLGGWAEGFLSEGYDVIGFDVEKHDYGTGGYPGQLVLQDVLTLHGSQFRNATVIVASPPCQAYSYRAMPWKRAKALPPPDNTLFEACFRIQREASEAAGRYIPLIVERARRGKVGWISIVEVWLILLVWRYSSSDAAAKRGGAKDCTQAVVRKRRRNWGEERRTRLAGHEWRWSEAPRPDDIERVQQLAQRRERPLYPARRNED